MTEQEVRRLLPAFVDGLLQPEQAREVEAAVKASPQLQAELQSIKEENALLSEALAPLRPTRSGRLRVVEAMQLAAQDMHRRAQHVADAMPERAWKIFRLCFAFVTLACWAYVACRRPAPLPAEGESLAGYYVTIGLLVVGITCLVLAPPLAYLESRLLGVFSRRDDEPSRLEVLTLEVFGIVSILAAVVFYLVRQ